MPGLLIQILIISNVEIGDFDSPVLSRKLAGHQAGMVLLPTPPFCETAPMMMAMRAPLLIAYSHASTLDCKLSRTLAL